MKTNLRCQIWLLSASELDTARPEWFAGQVSVDMRKDFRLVIQGKASNGGFAIDQLTFSSGECASRNSIGRIFILNNGFTFRSSSVCYS